MEVNTIDDFANSPAEAPKRPQFLSVLCILTWIWCGISLVQTVIQAVSPTSPEEQYEKIEEIREQNPELADQMERSFEVQRNINPVIPTSFGLVSSVLAALGAYLMWSLKRKGYYLYILGELLPYVTFLIIGWEATNAMLFGPKLAKIIISGMVFFDIVFFVLYALNLKHMRD